MPTPVAIRRAMLPVVALLLPVPSSAAEEARFVPGRLIVGFRADASAALRADVHAQVGAREVRPLLHPRMDLATFDESADLDALAAAYLARAAVEFAERDAIGEGGFIPDDTWYAAQWQHRNVGQSGGTPGADLESEDGWDFVIPVPLAGGGPDIVVAVLDSGIDSDHPEFAGRFLPGWDFMNGDSDPEDDHGHGTGVTGLLAANMDNAFSVSGVNPYCTILPIKVLDANNLGSMSSLLDGIAYASAQGADVLSMSLINYPCSTALNTALRDAKLAGAVLVACAGNGGIGNADVSCPGASSHTISIGATDHDDARASYSGTGNALDFVAPGDLVVTVAYDTAADTYELFNGCSAATPVAAGVVSLLRYLGAIAGVDLRNAEIRSILNASAEDLVGAAGEDTAGWDPYMGGGRLNLRAALQEFMTRTAAPVLASFADLALDVRPNPAAHDVALRFSLPSAAWVEAGIFDVSGRRVRTLARGPAAAGPHEVRWDGVGRDGARAAAGVYFARLEVAGRPVMRKLTLLR